MQFYNGAKNAIAKVCHMICIRSADYFHPSDKVLGQKVPIKIPGTADELQAANKKTLTSVKKITYTNCQQARTRNRNK